MSMDVGRRSSRLYNYYIHDTVGYLKKNLTTQNWKIEQEDRLQDDEGKKVIIIFGVTSEFGGVTVSSFVNHGGGFTPFYAKLIEVSGSKTEVLAMVTGSETVHGDWGDRNGKVAKTVIDMCDKDYEHVSLGVQLKRKLGGLFGK